MSKVSFTKLGITKYVTTNTLEWQGQTIEVKAYLPIQEKMNLIAAVLNQCQDDNNFINAAALYMFRDLELVFRYTNIRFTEKQLSKPAELYDLLDSSGLLRAIIHAIPDREYSLIDSWLKDTAKNIYEYRNSAYGIMDALAKDYSNLQLDVETLQKSIADPQNMALLKDVLTKLG